MVDEYIPTRLDEILCFYYDHERTILEAIALIIVIGSLAVIGILPTILMAILTLTIGWITKWVYRRALAKLASRELRDISGVDMEAPPTIRDMHELIYYFRHVKESGEELDKNNPLYKKKINGEDIAYQ